MNDRALVNIAMEAFMKTHSLNSASFVEALDTIREEKTDLNSYNNPEFGHCLMLGNIAAFYVFKAVHGGDKALDYLCGNDGDYRRIYMHIDENLTKILEKFSNDDE
jgi:hypothetical protein